MCKSDPAESPLDALLVAIREYVETRGRELTAAQFGEHLIRLRHGLDLLEVDFAICAAIFAKTDEYEAEGSVFDMAARRVSGKTGESARAFGPP